METVLLRILVVLLFTIKIFASEDKNISNAEDGITTENVEIEKTTGTTTKVTPHEIKDNWPALQYNKTLIDETAPRHSNSVESELVRIVLKENNQREIDDTEKNFAKYLVNLTTKSLDNSNGSQGLNLADKEFVQIVLKDVKGTANNREESKNKVQHSTESFAEVDTNTSAGNEIITKPLRDLVSTPDLDQSKLVHIVLKDVSNLRNSEEERNINAKNSTESVAGEDPYTATLSDLITRPLNGLEASQNFSLAEGQLDKIAWKDVRNSGNYQEEGKGIENNTISAQDVSVKNMTEKLFIEIILKDVKNVTQSHLEAKFIAQNSTGSLGEVDYTTLAKGEFSTKPSVSLQELENSSLPENILFKPVMRDAKQEETEYIEQSSTDSLIEVNFTTLAAGELSTKPSISLEEFENRSLPENILFKPVMRNEKQKETKNIGQSSTDSLIEVDFTTFAEGELSTKPSTNLVSYRNSKFAEKELITKNVNEFKISKEETENIEQNSTEYLVDVSTTASIEFELATKALDSLETALNPNADDSKSLPVKLSTVPQDSSEIFSESLEDTTTTPAELSTKPAISLEDYAVKQMNFILDHLLMETQEFVTNVLQATANSVFPRDHLKLYAEGLNRILNPDIYSDYSDESIQDTKTATQDELYENIVQKLNFLKSKTSKFLQKQLPPDWVNEYHKTRTDLAIWLDKATEQLHQEFNHYISEEDDYIKYTYFNETFDDISRATEIHHKLALLADLVKIVKNKKQITFMDLYMAT